MRHKNATLINWWKLHGYKANNANFRDEFKDSANAVDDYDYDVNGNMIKGQQNMRPQPTTTWFAYLNYILA
jgi:hypothetical protein